MLRVLKQVWTKGLSCYVLQGGAVTVTPSMLSAREDAKNIRFSVTNAIGGVLLLDGERATSFSDADLAAGAVTFAQQQAATERLYDGGIMAGFGFTFAQHARVSKPMFFPVAVLGQEPVPVPQARLAAMFSAPFCVTSCHPPPLRLS